MKTCCACHITQPFENFYFYKGRSVGPCKSCRRIIDRQRRINNPESCAAAQKRYRASAKGKATRRAYESAMSEEARREKFHRNWARRSEHIKAKARARHSADPRKQNARLRVWRAVQAGLLARPEQCEMCAQVSKHIEAHHDDYDKPLDVKWFCARCHRNYDKARREAA